MDYAAQFKRTDDPLKLNHLVSETVKGVPGVRPPKGVKVGPIRLHDPMSKEVRDRRALVLKRTQGARGRRQSIRRKWISDRRRKYYEPRGWREIDGEWCVVVVLFPMVLSS